MSANGKTFTGRLSFDGKRRFKEAVVEISEGLKTALREWVLQKIRTGFTVEQISLALAAQKVELMQADQYLTAIRDNERRP